MTGCKYKMGVTLVEILIVVSIITILASMVIGMATRIGNQSKEKSLQDTFALLESALEEYREHEGAFPDGVDPDPNVNSEILYEALYSIPGSRKILEQISDSLIADKGGPSDTPEIYDPWGTILLYVYAPAQGDNFPELKSAGPDKNFGNTDDISSK